MSGYIRVYTLSGMISLSHYHENVILDVKCNFSWEIQLIT